MPDAVYSAGDFSTHEQRYLNIKDTATRLGFTSQKIYLLVVEGRLAAINISLRPGVSRAVYRIRADAVIAPKDAWKNPDSVLQTMVDFTPLRPLLLVKAVAERLSCSQEHVAKLIVAGKITATDLALRGAGRACYRIPVPAVERYIADCRVE